MRKKIFGETLRGYLCDRRKLLLFFMLCLSIFAVVMALLSISLDAVGYASLLCATFGLIFILIDFSRYLQKHAELSRLTKVALLEMSALPAAQGLIENDYHRLLQSLLETQAHATDAAEHLQRAQSDYYSLWAHQIKVPIAAMRLLLQADVGKHTAALTAELFKVEQYVEMTLGYVRLNGASTDYVLKSYALDGIIKQAVRKFAPLFIQKKLKVEVRETNLMALTDEKWLVFVLEQLLSNAIKYTKHGSVTIYVDEFAQELILEDTGIGIAPEDLPRIFEQGYTGYNGRGDKRATGLGLYLAKQVLVKLSHTIWITSEVGKGTRVTLGLWHAELQVE